MNLAATMSLSAGAFNAPLNQARGNLAGVIGEIGKLGAATERMNANLSSQSQALANHMRETTRQMYLMRVEATATGRAISSGGGSGGGGVLGGLAGQLSGALKQFAGVGAIIAAFASGKEVASGIMEQFEKGHELERLSRITGESVSNLVVLQKAFSAAGIDASDLGHRIAMLQRSLGGVNEMGEPTAKVFERLGLSAAELQRMGLPQSLDAIGERLRQLPSAAQRTNTAMQIFGRSGAEMVGLLTDPQALGAAMTKHAQLGQVMEEHAEQFSKITKSYKGFKGEVSGIFTGLATAVSGPLSGALDMMRGLLKRIKEDILFLTGNGRPADDTRPSTSEIEAYATKLLGPKRAPMAPWTPPSLHYDRAELDVMASKTSGDFKSLLDRLAINTPFASPERIDAAFASMAARAFQGTNFMGEAPVTLAGMISKLTMEFNRLDGGFVRSKTPDIDAVKMERIQAALEKIVPLQDQLTRLQLERSETALKDFFGSIDNPDTVDKKARAFSPETDRLARIGGFIGGPGGPALDYARRTARGVEQLVGLIRLVPGINPGAGQIAPTWA